MFSQEAPIQDNDRKPKTVHAFISNLDDIFMDTLHFIDLRVWDKVVCINNAEKVVEYKSRPNMGEIFLFVDTEGTTFRGRRIRDPANSELMRIHLIDTGKILEIKFVIGSFFELPTHLNFPDLSTKCIFKNAYNIIKDGLFKWVVLRKLTPTTDNSGYIQEFILSNDKHDSEVNGITKETLTQEELDILHEEPLNTSDPMMATLGYSVKDDTRCQFYDEKTGGCFKRGRCFKDHYPEDNHEVRSQTEIFFDNIPMQLDLPAVNSMIFIYPLHFEAINLLYAHIIQSNKFGIDSESDLLKLDSMMNSSTALKSYEKLQETPAINQLVIAPRWNNKYYRAKICNINDNDTCNVFFVDYGYKITLKNNELRQYKKLYNFLPFQAIELIIGNIKAVTNPFIDMVAIEELNVWIKRNCFNFHAKILQNVGDIVINLYDNEGFDVGEILDASKKAKLQEFISISEENNLFPG